MDEVKVSKFVSELTLDELKRLIDMTHDRLRELYRRRETDLKHSFIVGAKVHFDHRGTPVFGEIVKCNPSRAKVRIGRNTGISRIWNVPYSMLTLE